MEHYLCNFVLFLEPIDRIGLIWANAHLNIAKMLLFFLLKLRCTRSDQWGLQPINSKNIALTN